jgi:hypothetical protein
MRAGKGTFCENYSITEYADTSSDTSRYGKGKGECVKDESCIR